MKKIFILFIALILNCNEVFAFENFFNEDWWKTATVEGVKAEIANGADVNAKDVVGQTALIFAATNVNNPKIVEALLDAGADINIKDKGGFTALDWAKMVYNTAVVKVLQNYASSQHNTQASHFQPYQNQNADNKYSNFLDVNWWKTATVEDVEAEIANGADVKAKCELDETKGFTALMFAAALNENPEIIKVLLNAGADVNAKNNDGRTALMNAAGYNENPEVIKALIDAKADVNIMDVGEKTPLMYATKNKNIQIVKILLDAGADVNAKGNNNGGITALDYAKVYKRHDVMEFLQEYQNNFNEFDEMFAECYSTQNISSYANKFCECAIKTAINALGPADKEKAKDAFDDARAGTFKNLIQKGKSAAFNECY